MKLIYIISLIIAFVSLEAMAQRNRPSSGRDSSRSGSSSSSSGSSSSTVSSGARSGGGSSYGGSSSSSSSSGSYSGGSNYGSSYGSSSGSYSSSYSYYGADYIQRAQERRRGRNTAPILQHRLEGNWGSPINTGNVAATRPYLSGRYRVRVHVSVTYGVCHTHHYPRGRDYYTMVDSHNVYRNWVMEPTPFYYDNGYHCINGYPYYVHNGYRHRYSTEDLCNYDLVDLKDNSVTKTFYNLACSVAFDTCAVKRDQLNKDEDVQRFVCIERVDEDLSNEVDNIPGVVNQLTPQQIKEAQDFVKSNKPKQLFKIGKKDGYKKCKIEKVGRNSNEGKCNYMVKVEGKTYPFTDGKICSNAKNTSLEYLGCSSSSQEENASCLLSLAILEGYCH